MAPDFWASNKETQHGLYGTANLNLADPLHVIIGARMDWYDFRDDALWIPVGTTDEDRWGSAFEYNAHLTKYVGIVFDVDRNHSLYASYSDIFKPQDLKTTANKYITPIVGKNFEFGVKGEYFDGALNLSAALFRINEDNRGIPDGPCPFNPQMTCYRPAGQVRSEGFELEAQGALTERWQIAAGYTHVTTKVSKDPDPATVGQKQNTHLPKQQFKLSTTYRMPGDAWRVGASLRWQGRIYHEDDWAGYVYHTGQRAYAVVDALVGYQANARLNLQLNVYNLFDKRYFSSINAQPVVWGGNTVYGTPRDFRLTARYRF
ncbi:TonB-dependent siderophore receptor [Sphingomonas flavalba]|uniref:TonB-dependent siderophore receptor n=1 Tax=Sphingomonas flavalba TaxID=2559804 RepID=UPI0039DF7BDD